MSECYPQRLGRSFLFILIATLAAAQDPAELYRHTDYAGALQAIAKISNPDGAVLLLAGKSSFMQGDLKKATQYVEKAVERDPKNPEYLLWMGRIWGRKAESGNPFTAPSAASHARDYFEKAVALDPQNPDATGDLFDFYLDAPGLLGGGLDKAEALAKKIEAFDPPEGQFDLGRFREAVKLNPQASGHVIGLARFLAQQGRTNESDAVLARAPEGPRFLFGRASILIESHRNVEEAHRLLEQYLKSDLTPDDPSREAARKLLK
jgi:Flp pilus assembly protein TadD